MIGDNLGIIKEEKEDMYDYVDKVVNILKIDN